MKLVRDIKDNKSFIFMLTKGNVLLLNGADDSVTDITEMLNALFASVFIKFFQGSVFSERIQGGHLPTVDKVCVENSLRQLVPYNPIIPDGVHLMGVKVFARLITNPGSQGNWGRLRVPEERHVLCPSLKQSSKSREKLVIFFFWPLEDRIASPFGTHSGFLKEKVVENNQHGFTRAKYSWPTCLLSVIKKIKQSDLWSQE